MSSNVVFLIKLCNAGKLNPEIAYANSVIDIFLNHPMLGPNLVFDTPLGLLIIIFQILYFKYHV